MRSTVSVIHLVWMPYGLDLFTGFVDSYKAHPAGYPHQLVLLFNGITNENEAILHHQYIQQSGIPYQAYYYKTGQDLEAYRWAANQLSSDYVLFLNSYSRFLAENWLQKYMQVQHATNAGIIGATGSWQSYYSAIFQKHSWRIDAGVSFQQNFTKYKLLIKTIFLWRWYFKPFPNPHVRTNAFLINRTLFLQLELNPVIRKKMDAYRIESGNKSITNQITRKSLSIFLIGKNGDSYTIENWNTSNIFWTNQQENLLITDNQTETYEHADVNEKKILEALAWG